MNAEVNLIIKTDLACLLESFFYSGNQHSFVIAFRDVSLASEGKNLSAESIQCFNHLPDRCKVREKRVHAGGKRRKAFALQVHAHLLRIDAQGLDLSEQRRDLSCARAIFSGC
jgi:hypothetical protein